MAQEWYFAFEGTSKGPIDQDEFEDLIANGTIRSDTLVWQEGMEDWIPLAQARSVSRTPPQPPRRPVSDMQDPAREDANSFMGALKDGFARYVDFRTRSTRSQFWWWMVWMILLGGLTGGLDAALGFYDVGPINGLFSLATLLPSIAVAIRRLHDIGRTGWWVLLYFIPILGWIVLIIFYCQRSQDHANQWGNEPAH
ncbi:DUF805 domain-containing protein [Sulfitobacter albidus]|uniref:DUF805 domain-containing protein n=1 Tax=Sulfitobacter albidus TaxID=2829501 RepID=A0A975JCS3_9RHOB|nr:DUF805 domain-containing protein [Sulfitobacter albidus]QUJ75972.1 DUF805 domain-containing protein [Sulfitobacter albidus]